MSSAPLPCVTLWIGPALGAVERACMRSILCHDHPLALYCYDEPAGVPDGVEVRDAAEILPEHLIVRHRTGSVSLFSNRFRYELQRRGCGVWVDADYYFLAPLPDDRSHLFGHDEDGVIGSGLLRLPQDSPLLPELLAPFDERKVPRWLPPRARAAAWWRLRRTGRTQIAEMPWGSLGPKALTAVARRHGAERWALPPEVLCPVHWDDAVWIRDPAVGVHDVTTPRTIAVHLYNELIKSFKDQPAPPGSFLARLQAEGA
jgi:hypothetical protein